MKVINPRRLEDSRNTIIILTDELIGLGTLSRSGRRWEGNIKQDLKGICVDMMNFVELVWIRDH